MGRKPFVHTDATEVPFSQAYLKLSSRKLFLCLPLSMAKLENVF